MSAALVTRNLETKIKIHRGHPVVYPTHSMILSSYFNPPVIMYTPFSITYHAWFFNHSVLLFKSGKRIWLELVSIPLIKLVLEFHPMKTQSMQKGTESLHT